MRNKWICCCNKSWETRRGLQKLSNAAEKENGPRVNFEIAVKLLLTYRPNTNKEQTKHCGNSKYLPRQTRTPHKGHTDQSFLRKNSYNCILHKFFIVLCTILSRRNIIFSSLGCVYGRTWRLLSYNRQK